MERKVRGIEEIRGKIKSWNLAMKQDTVSLEVGAAVIRELLWVLGEDLNEDLLEIFKRWAKETQL